MVGHYRTDFYFGSEGDSRYLVSLEHDDILPSLLLAFHSPYLTMPLNKGTKHVVRVGLINPLY